MQQGGASLRQCGVAVFICLLLFVVCCLLLFVFFVVGGPAGRGWVGWLAGDGDAKFRNPWTPLNLDASAGVQEFLSRKPCSIPSAFVMRAGLGMHDTLPAVARW